MQNKGTNARAPYLNVARADSVQVNPPSMASGGNTRTRGTRGERGLSVESLCHIYFYEKNRYGQ
jgi:hypothetical protein